MPVTEKMASDGKTHASLRLLTVAVSDVSVNQSLEKLPVTTSTIKRVTLASGHTTSDADAEEFLNEVYEFLCKVEQGKVEHKSWRHFRGEEEVLFEREDGKVSFGGPKKKFLKFIRKPKAGCCPVS